MTRLQAVDSIRVYTAAEATAAMNTSRQKIDAACLSGALVAVDETPDSTRRSWRVLEADLIDWHHRGRPLVPPS